jgi:hypothetical protein
MKLLCLRLSNLKPFTKQRYDYWDSRTRRGCKAFRGTRTTANKKPWETAGNGEENNEANADERSIESGPVLKNPNHGAKIGSIEVVERRERTVKELRFEKWLGLKIQCIFL